MSQEPRLDLKRLHEAVDARTREEGESSRDPSSSFEIISCELVAQRAIDDATFETTENFIDVGYAPSLPEAVHGEDSRHRVPPAMLSEYPFRLVCKLYMVFGSKVFMGSGWLVNSTTVVTAGHCVYSRGQWASTVTVIPAMSDRDKSRFGEFYATKLTTTKAWATASSPPDDIGLIRLHADVEQESFFNFSGDVSPEHTLLVIGYPGDKHNGRFMYYAEGQAGNIANDVISYAIDTYGGQSGSPVFNNSTNRVVAIHNYGGAASNSGSRVTQALSSLIGTFTTGNK